MAQTRHTYSKPERLSFPQDEAIFPWLAPLLDAYGIADQGIAEALSRQTKRGRRLACARGCANCCRAHQDVPVYPLELVGISWYATEKIQGPERQALKRRLREYQAGTGCPFLLEDACAVHPLRPLACRQFNVLDHACAPGEDAYHTRRNDVLRPLRKYTEEALYTTLPFYGVQPRTERRRALKAGALHALATELRRCRWDTLVRKMDERDARKPL